MREGDRVLYFTTTGWMMWNWLVSVLASGATTVLYDGSPTSPRVLSLFEVVDRERVSLLGVSAKLIDLYRKLRQSPNTKSELFSLRTICSTGSPLSPEGFEWVYTSVKRDVHLASISGGTDLCGCFVGGDPRKPVRSGEIQSPILGMDVDVIDEAKKRPGTVTLNGGGHGTDDHVAALGIGASNGTSLQMVHFRGTPEGKTQVLGGNIEVYACNVSEGAEDVKAGVIRPLGVMSPTRSKFMPNVPTFREQGFNEVWSTSRGIAAPAGLPKDVEAALIAVLEKTIGSAEHKAKAEALSLDPKIIKGAAYTKFLKENEQATKKLMNW